jgi:hypothetical protein
MMINLIILNDGLYNLIPVTQQVLDSITLITKVDCFELCDLIRNQLTTYINDLNTYVMNDKSGYFYGCICK